MNPQLSPPPPLVMTILLAVAEFSFLQRHGRVRPQLRVLLWLVSPCRTPSRCVRAVAMTCFFIFSWLSSKPVCAGTPVCSTPLPPDPCGTQVVSVSRLSGIKQEWECRQLSHPCPHFLWRHTGKRRDGPYGSFTSNIWRSLYIFHSGQTNLHSHQHGTRFRNPWTTVLCI